MKPTKFHSMKEYDSTKDDWKLVAIALFTWAVFAIAIVLIGILIL